VLQERGKETGPPGSPIPQMAGLSMGPPSPMRPAAPPRPSAMSKPHSQSSHPPRVPVEDDSDEDNVEEEDENDPFADRNAVVTPKVEREEPKW